MKTLILGKGYVGNYIAKGGSPDDVVHLGKQDLDYSNPTNLEDLLTKRGFDWIINCSGYTGKPNVDACEDDKANCYHYNVTVPLYLTKVANKFNVPILHIGSGCIYTDYSSGRIYTDYTKIYDENDSANFGAASHLSSFYSKTKDAFEKLSANMKRYIFRIRIPFNGVPEPKNYLYKLLNYDNLISCKNSITNVDDLVKTVYKFIEKRPELGVYNVTNPGAISAKEVTEIMKKYGLENKNWKFVTIDEAKFRVGRSNCVLSTEKLQAKADILLPDVTSSVEKAIREYASAVDKTVSY